MCSKRNSLFLGVPGFFLWYRTSGVTLLTICAFVCGRALGKYTPSPCLYIHIKIYLYICRYILICVCMYDSPTYAGIIMCCTRLSGLSDTLITHCRPFFLLLPMPLPCSVWRCLVPFANANAQKKTQSKIIRRRKKHVIRDMSLNIMHSHFVRLQKGNTIVQSTIWAIYSSSNPYLCGPHKTRTSRVY